MFVGNAFRMDLSVRELQLSRRNGSVAPVILWNNGSIEVVATPETDSSIEKALGDLIDELLNEWLKANPR